MKKILTILILIVTISLFAEGWKVEAGASLTLSQNAYSDNWAGEEKGSISWVANGNFLAEKQLTLRVHNKNTLKLAFGQTHNQYLDMNGEKQWAKAEKSTDLIDFESILRFTLGGFVDPFTSFRFQSQFVDYSMPGETKVINPITLTEGVGIAKVIIQKEKHELVTRLGAAFKQNINAHELIDNTNDGGLVSITDYNRIFNNDTMMFTSKLEFYKAMFFSDEDNDPDEKWKALDMAWENILTAKIYKMISLNLYFQMLYDEQIIDEFRYKETLGMGITWDLF